MATLFTMWPINVPMSWPFSRNPNPYLGGAWGHLGADFAAGMGTPIYATRDGRVVYSGWSQYMPNPMRIGYGAGNPDGGVMTLIDHGGFATNYLHQSVTYVSSGQWVQRGQLIGAVGATGNVTGAHLHYEFMPVFPIQSFSPPVLGREDPRSVTDTTIQSKPKEWWEMPIPDEELKKIENASYRAALNAVKEFMWGKNARSKVTGNPIAVTELLEWIDKNVVDQGKPDLTVDYQAPDAKGKRAGFTPRFLIKRNNERLDALEKTIAEMKKQQEEILKAVTK